MKSVLPELSIQLTNFHSDVNGHQKTSLDFLCFKFHQISYNAVTVKNDVSCTTTVSDMQTFLSISQGLKDVIIHLNH